MIAKLKGILDSCTEDRAVIDVGGVGYLVFCSSRTLSALPKPGEAVSLTIETQVREDHIHLFGFFDIGERDWFRLLLSVQGVGSKVALAILGVLTSEELLQAIAAQDKAVIGRAPGVGPKLATRIVSELKDKAGNLALDATLPAGPPVGLSGITSEAASALVNLGYGRSEALGVISGAARRLGDGATLNDLIKAGLAQLAPPEH